MASKISLGAVIAAIVIAGAAKAPVKPGRNTDQGHCIGITMNLLRKMLVRV